MKLWLKWLSISWFHDFSFSFLLKLQATSGAPHTQSYHRNHDVCRNHSKLLTLLAQVNITSTSETRESGKEPVFFYFEIILLIPRNKMYSIKYTSEVIYVQSSLSENVLLVYSWALYLLKVSLRWRPLSIRSFVVFGSLSFFFHFWFTLFCLNSSILLPQRFCCFFHLKTFEIVFTGLSMYRLSVGEKSKIFVNSLSQGFKHILRIRENCTHSSNKGENCDIFISSTKNVNGFY